MRTYASKCMTESIHPSKLSAAIALWAMLQGPWVQGKQWTESHDMLVMIIVSLFLPLLALLVAWRRTSPLVLKAVFPLSLLPFAILVPESIQPHNHTVWTLIPIALLWAYVSLPDQFTTKELGKLGNPTSIPMVIWFCGGLLLVVANQFFFSDENESLVGGWTIACSILWICFSLIFVRYRKAEFRRDQAGEKA